MRIASWNVNGFRAVLKKGFQDYLAASNLDIVCLQEVKANAEQVTDLAAVFEGYHYYWHAAEKAGYAGTCIATKTLPINVIYGLEDWMTDSEGRVICLEFKNFFLINVYTPNAQNELKRIDFRQQWDTQFAKFCQAKAEQKPVIMCGDFNVAHQAIDLARPKQNEGKAGYSKQERAGFNALLARGFCDIFRTLYPSTEEAYSWWSYRAGARDRNIGWRIDYFCCSENIMPRMRNLVMRKEVTGSDHCPLELTMTDG